VHVDVIFDKIAPPVFFFLSFRYHCFVSFVVYRAKTISSIRLTEMSDGLVISSGSRSFLASLNRQATILAAPRNVGFLADLGRMNE
jgi:hypothetical protein